jgi:hypothetical protein
MFTITYNGNEAGVVNSNNEYIYKFDSQESARSAVKNASQFIVIYQPGSRDRLVESSPAALQQIKIHPPTSFDL